MRSSSTLKLWRSSSLAKEIKKQLEESIGGSRKVSIETVGQGPVMRRKTVPRLLDEPGPLAFLIVLVVLAFLAPSGC